MEAGNRTPNEIPEKLHFRAKAAQNPAHRPLQSLPSTPSWQN